MLLKRRKIWRRGCLKRRERRKVRDKPEVKKTHLYLKSRRSRMIKSYQSQGEDSEASPFLIKKGRRGNRREGKGGQQNRRKNKKVVAMLPVRGESGTRSVPESAVGKTAQGKKKKGIPSWGKQSGTGGQLNGANNEETGKRTKFGVPVGRHGDSAKFPEATAERLQT